MEFASLATAIGNAIAALIMSLNPAPIDATSYNFASDGNLYLPTQICEADDITFNDAVEEQLAEWGQWINGADAPTPQGRVICQD